MYIWKLLHVSIDWNAIPLKTVARIFLWKNENIGITSEAILVNDILKTPHDSVGSIITFILLLMTNKWSHLTFLVLNYEYSYAWVPNIAMLSTLTM